MFTVQNVAHLCVFNSFWITVKVYGSKEYQQMILVWINLGLFMVSVDNTKNTDYDQQLFQLLHIMCTNFSYFFLYFLQ